jgi:hypothetical protein
MKNRIRFNNPPLEVWVHTSLLTAAVFLTVLIVASPGLLSLTA